MTALAWISISVAVVCAFIILADELRHPQGMAVMNVVWPATALYFGVFAVWAYFRLGRAHTRRPMQRMKDSGARGDREKAPSAGQVALGTTHCGAGCVIADLVTEFAIAGSGLILFGSMLWTEYVLDFAAAWVLGIVFQYFAIKPMRQELSVAEAVWTAIKADTLSILAFQVGMYLFMALVYFRVYPAPHLTPFDSRYWLMMQIAMICGFVTSFPMNRWLISIGLKEKM